MKHGFTLIELLAVIVILAIIALIAVPVVINIINDSKTSSEEQSVELYLDTAIKTITKKQLSSSNFNPDKCIIQSNGDLDCYNGNQKLETLQVDVKGQTPEKGIIELKENKYNYKNILLNGKYYYEKGILVDDADNNNEISIGDKYTYKVNDKDKFNFYVLSFNNDNTVNLIMNRNICGSATDENTSNNGQVATSNNRCLIAWYADRNTNEFGPVTAMQGLYNATKNWINVPNMSLEYSDITDNTDSGYTGSTMYGYTGITITNGVGYITKKDGITKIPITITDNKPIKARLPKLKEITDTGCHVGYLDENYGSCPAWLVENMTYYNVSSYTGSENTDKYLVNNNNGITNINGYWLLSSNPIDYNTVRYVFCRGLVDLILGPYLTNYNGLRPVITVPIEDLLN